MSKQRTYYARCPECGKYPVTCSDCGSKGTGSTPNSDWMRSSACPENLTSKYFDLQNLDYIWFNYRQGWLSLLEEKMFGKTQSVAQGDTHNIISQLISLGAETEKPIKTMRGLRPISYKGYYKVVFENTTPDNSEWISVNGVKTGKDGYLKFLSNGKL